MSLEDYLTTEYLSDGSLDWTGLGSGLIGGLFLAFWSGLIKAPTAILEAFSRYWGGLESGIENGGDEIVSAIEAGGEAVWDPFTFGFLSLPVTMAAILVAMTIIAWGWSRVLQ